MPPGVSRLKRWPSCCCLLLVFACVRVVFMISLSLLVMIFFFVVFFSFFWNCVRFQGPGTRDSSASDVVLRVLPRHVPPSEGVPHVHHRRNAAHAGALHQLCDVATLAEAVPKYVHAGCLAATTIEGGGGGVERRGGGICLTSRLLTVLHLHSKSTQFMSWPL